MPLPIFDRHWADNYTRAQEALVFCAKQKQEKTRRGGLYSKEEGGRLGRGKGKVGGSGCRRRVV